MRESRQNSVLTNNEKLKYPRCDRKKEHAKESLSFVCLAPHCKLRGLICLQCKTLPEHTGHPTQPLRTFLSKLEDSLKHLELSRAPKMEESACKVVTNEHSLLEKLEEQQLETLSLLKLQVEEIAEKVRSCEEEVMREFGRVREKVSTEYQKETIISKTLAEVQRFFSEAEGEDPPALKLNVLKLLSLLKVDKNNISVLNEAEKELNSYSLSAKTFKNNILAWERESSLILSDIFKVKLEYQLKENHLRPTTAVDSRPVALAFSAQLKTDSVVLDKELRIAKVKDDKHGKVVMLNQSVLEHKNSPVRFKITGQMGASAIQLGLCMKSHLVQKLFKFEKNTPGHGLFVASSNGFAYSSNDPQVNATKGHLTFKSGDEVSVEVEVKESKLLVRKKNDPKAGEVSLKHLSESDWKELYFCVSLSSVGDKVQLLA